ncbi:MAG: hypothetical protein DRO05_01495 [Thermoproteota archaeon]|nr:MAG: hypothetical protein DRO05_01495 [Candidatus Korarchaeota archaeon]
MVLVLVPTLALQTKGQNIAEKPEYWIDLFLNYELAILEVNQSVLLNLPSEVRDIRFKVYPNAFRPQGWINIGSVSVEGIPVENFRFTEVDNTTLVIPLPENLPNKERIRVNLSYSVKVPEIEDRFGRYDNIMALGNWFPILAVFEGGRWVTHPYAFIGESFYSQCANFTVTIRTKANLVIAATGFLVKQQKIGEITFQTWKASNVRDFAITISPDYKVYETKWENVTVYSYYVPEHEVFGVFAAEIASRCLEIFSKKFGRYPYPEFRVVEVHSWFGGMEYPTIIFISSDLYSGEVEDSYAWSLLQLVIAHEVAHQWWYGVIGNDQYENPWLDEALTEYSGMLYFKFVYGDREFQRMFNEYVANDYYKYVAEKGDYPIATSVANFTNPEAYNAIVYSKGAMVFRLLNYLMGDEAFFRGLRLYYEQNRFGITKPKDLIDAFEASSGQQLDWFFNRWVFNSGTPSYEIIDVITSKSGRNYAVKVILKQEVSRGEPFCLPVVLKFVCKDGLNVSFCELINSTISELEFYLPCEPIQVLVDPEDVIPGKDQGWIKPKSPRRGRLFVLSYDFMAFFLFLIPITAFFIYKKCLRGKERDSC